MPVFESTTWEMIDIDRKKVGIAAALIGLSLYLTMAWSLSSIVAIANRAAPYAAAEFPEFGLAIELMPVWRTNQLPPSVHSTSGA